MEVIAIAGKTRPTNGTKIEGKYAAVIKKNLLVFKFCIYF